MDTSCPLVTSLAVLTQSTPLEKIENLHLTDSIDTENLSTRGRSVWVHSSQVRLLDTSVPHSSMPEAVGLLGTGVTRDQVSTPRPARPSGA